jgi:hypothetical protein
VPSARAWFNMAAVRVTLAALARKIKLTRSASEGWDCPCLRVGLMCPQSYPLLNHALARTTRRSWRPAATNGASVLVDIFEDVEDGFEDADDIFEDVDPLDTFQSRCCHWTYSKMSSQIRRFGARQYAVDTFELR